MLWRRINATEPRHKRKQQHILARRVVLHSLDETCLEKLSAGNANHVNDLNLETSNVRI